MICPDYLTEGLEQSYRRIQRERMRDLPFLNPALRVKAVGFRHWQGRCLGVLITPWFMNLMLLPCEGDEWQELQIGDKQRHLLPSGSYEFIVGEEAGIGGLLVGKFEHGRKQGTHLIAADTRLFSNNELIASRG